MIAVAALGMNDVADEGMNDVADDIAQDTSPPPQLFHAVWSLASDWSDI